MAADLLAERSEIATALEKAGLRSADIPGALAEAERCRHRLLSDLERAASLAALVDRVELGPGSLRLILSLCSLIHASLIGEACVLVRELPLRVKRRGVELKLVIDGPGPKPTMPDPVLLKEIRRAYRCFDALVAGRVGSIELAAVEGVSDRYVSSLLPLAFLAPDIVEAIAAGKQPADLTAHRLIRNPGLPIEWAAQKRQLGFA